MCANRRYPWYAFAGKISRTRHNPPFPNIMDTNLRNQDQNESNAGAGMNDNSAALHNAVRKNAGHPGDASHAAGMRRDSRNDVSSGQDNEPNGPEGTGREPFSG